jgi:hypothetical protein
MRLTNGILAATLALGALVLPGLAAAAAKPEDARPRTGCVSGTKLANENCSAKLTADTSAKARNVKPAPVETTGSTLSFTARAAHPRR